MGRDPGEVYRDLTREFGEPVYERIDAPATAEQKAALATALARARHGHRAGRRENPQRCSPRAPGDGQPIGGLKVIAENGWFAARPSGTEEIYKIYAESFRGEEHLRRIQAEAQAIVEPSDRRRRVRPSDR